MGQPPHIQRIIPCSCGSSEPYWHGTATRVYCCDACWLQHPGNALKLYEFRCKVVTRATQEAYVTVRADNEEDAREALQIHLETTTATDPAGDPIAWDATEDDEVFVEDGEEIEE